jgi:hypothetical protein
MKAVASELRRFGCRRIEILPNRQGTVMNHMKVPAPSPRYALPRPALARKGVKDSVAYIMRSAKLLTSKAMKSFTQEIGKWKRLNLTRS